jgi:hypothetical protein
MKTLMLEGVSHSEATVSPDVQRGGRDTSCLIRISDMQKLHISQHFVTRDTN